MKKLFGILALLVSAAVFFSACNKTDEMVPGKSGTTATIQKDLKNGLVYCGDPENFPVTVPLMAGKTIKAGYVEFGNDLTNMYLTYHATDGWLLSEVHLFVGDFGAIPMTKKGNVIPGQFPYFKYFNPGATSYTFVIPLEELGECSTLAFHAAVTKQKGDVTIKETAWAQLENSFAKPNWGWYGKYCIQKCVADHVVIFRNFIPWYRDWDPQFILDSQLDVLINLLGMTEGPGHQQYQVYPSSDMATLVLNPNIDLVIISNDQDQPFYNDYWANHEKFETFLNDGGHLLWEACDNGWHGGDMDVAGIILPGGITPNLSYENWNWISNAGTLLVGLPSPMDHNYASHEWFSTIPGTAFIYMKDDNGPTLLELPVGMGFMMLTGQPLEHQYKYIYGAPDMEELLPRILSYFTGVPLPPMMKAGKALAEGEATPSHID